MPMGMMPQVPQRPPPYMPAPRQQFGGGYGGGGMRPPPPPMQPGGFGGMQPKVAYPQGGPQPPDALMHPYAPRNQGPQPMGAGMISPGFQGLGAQGVEPNFGGFQGTPQWLQGGGGMMTNAFEPMRGEQMGGGYGGGLGPMQQALQQRFAGNQGQVANQMGRFTNDMMGGGMTQGMGGNISPVAGQLRNMMGGMQQGMDPMMRRRMMMQNMAGGMQQGMGAPQPPPSNYGQNFANAWE